MDLRRAPSTPSPPCWTSSTSRTPRPPCAPSSPPPPAPTTRRASRPGDASRICEAIRARGITVIDVIRALATRGFRDEAENLLALVAVAYLLGAATGGSLYALLRRSYEGSRRSIVGSP